MHFSKSAAVYFLSFKEAAANKKLLDHNLKEKRVQRLQFIDILLFYKEFAAAIICFIENVILPSLMAIIKRGQQL